MPADPRVLGALDISDRQMREHTAVLTGLKLLHVTKRGGGRGGAGTLTVCQLTEPADGALPRRMDADYLRIDERPKGRTPEKAIAASVAARNERKRASGQNPTAPETTQTIDRNPASGQTQAAAPNDRNHTSAQSAPGTAIDRNATSGQSQTETTIDRKQGSGQSPDTEAFDRKPASAQSATGDPVDNSTDRNPASGQTGDAWPSDEYVASGHSEIDRKPRIDSPEAPYRLTGSPASDSPKEENLTTHLLLLGGDVTSGAPDEPEPIDPELPEPQPAAGEPPDAYRDFDEDVVDELDPTALAASVPLVPPPDLEYDEARTILAALDPADLQERLSDAQGELEAEAAAAAASYDDGVQVTADSRQIMIRAAQIVLRAAPPETDP